MSGPDEKPWVARTQLFVDMWVQGSSIGDIAAELQVSPKSLSARQAELKKIGVVLPRRKSGRDVAELRWRDGVPRERIVITEAHHEAVLQLFKDQHRRKSELRAERARSTAHATEELRADGLTFNEGEVMDALILAANAFAKLPPQHPSERREFAEGIHRCQGKLAVRIARREYPAGWPDKSAAIRRGERTT